MVECRHQNRLLSHRLFYFCCARTVCALFARTSIHTVLNGFSDEQVIPSRADYNINDLLEQLAPNSAGDQLLHLLYATGDLGVGL